MSLVNWHYVGILEREVSLYNRLADEGVEVTFLTFGTALDEVYQSRMPKIKIVPIYKNSPLPKSNWRITLDSLLLPIKYRRFFKQFDLIKTNQMRGSLVPLVSHFVNASKFILRCGYELYEARYLEQRLRWNKGLCYWKSRISYFFAHKIIVSSEHTAEYVHKTFAIDKSKITVIRNWIDTDLFAPKVCEKSSRILSIGRLHRQKNYHLLIHAAHIANIGLDIVGRGPLKKNLEGLVAELGADVRFLSRVPNNKLPELINQYSIFVLVSVWEGSPKALLEAMSCARAVIGTDVVGIQEIIKDHVNGLLCKSNIESMVELIFYLYSNPALQEKLGKQAREYVLKNCSLSGNIAKELGVYQACKPSFSENF